MPIEPVGHRILIKPDALEQVDPAYKKLQEMGFRRAEHEDALREQASIDTGVVMAMGATVYQDFKCEPWCSVGDRVAYAKYSGKSVSDPVTKEKYLILNDEDIVCRFTEDK